MKIMFILLPLIAFAAFLDMNASPLAMANVSRGFPYPIADLRHAFVFLAVGLLAGRYPDRRRWVPPAVFVLFFAVGLSAGMQNPAALPAPISLAITTSLILLGGLALSARRPPLGFLVPLLVLLALIHGFAHGVQVSSSENAMRVSREIVTAAAILILAGLAVGVVLRYVVQHGYTPPPAEPRETPDPAPRDLA